MKKLCVIACSLLVAAALAFGVASTAVAEIPQEPITMCDMDYDFVSY